MLYIQQPVCARLATAVPPRTGHGCITVLATMQAIGWPLDYGSFRQGKSLKDRAMDGQKKRTPAVLKAAGVLLEVLQGLDFVNLV